ncbi:hypothetical protein BC829DRAFT_440739 [Chytridium lagenaria]|nr:hypothetical protein BC829DRAFT_440739 [Chytridium lagenaria]
MASPADDPKRSLRSCLTAALTMKKASLRLPSNLLRRLTFSNSNTITQKVSAKLDATPSPNLATNDAIRSTIQISSPINRLIHSQQIQLWNSCRSFPYSPEDIASDNAISDDEKRERITAIFIRACSNGDIGKVGMMLGKIKETSTMKQMSKTGLTLTGKTRMELQLSSMQHEGANVDDRDKNGWTPLLWACSNGHEDSAKTLIECGASKDLKSNRGRSLDIVKRDASQEMRKILDMEQSKPESSFIDGSLFFAKDEDSGYGDDTKLKRDESQRISVAYPSAKSDLIPSTSSDSDSDVDDTSLPFDWDRCSLDQMLVFDEKKMDGILKVAIVNLQPSAQRRQRRKKLSKPIPANIMILCARYAHYWNTPEFLDTFFSKALAVIVGEIQKTPDDSHLLAHHIANTAQLIRYLRRDPGLRSSTTDHQATFTELLRELYVLFSHNLTRQLLQVLDAALIDHGEKEAIANTRFENAFTGLGRRRPLLQHQTTTSNESKRSAPRRIGILGRWSASKEPYKVTPRTLLTILDSSKNALTSSGVHPSIIRQSIIQALHHINATLFNRVLTSRDLHCRARAMQGNVLWHLKPTLQICQFLQVATSLQDLGELLETMAGLDAITIPQIGRTMVGYRYEIGEPSFPEEVEAYVMKVGEDIRRVEEDGDLEGLLDVVVPPFLLPAMSGTEADVGWAWARAVPFIPDGCMRMLDQESLEELGEGWDGGLS